jgi:hypothetical protein
MPHDLMTRCEERRQFVVGGNTEWRWKEVPVGEAIGAFGQSIRCSHCTAQSAFIDRAWNTDHKTTWSIYLIKTRNTVEADSTSKASTGSPRIQSSNRGITPSAA